MANCGTSEACFSTIGEPKSRIMACRSHAKQGGKYYYRGTGNQTVGSAWRSVGITHAEAFGNMCRCRTISPVL